ncbi:MAG: hypothetical protein JWP06_446 [Candidatus Saccharibacteria bacterium]|nr:hypothetical protein [Candidatus Saccharibacteria bacterium]
MPSPERIGQVGTVVITYRLGHDGPKRVQLVSKQDFDRLAALVKPSPRPRTLSEKFEFFTYTLGGFIRRSAVEGKKDTLKPNHIKRVEFTRPIHVAN